MAFFKEFHDTCRFDKFLNACFITVVAKKIGAISITDFWPIS